MNLLCKCIDSVRIEEPIAFPSLSTNLKTTPVVSVREIRCVSCGRVIYSLDPSLENSDFSIDIKLNIQANEPVSHARRLIEHLKSSIETPSKIIGIGKNSMPLLWEISRLLGRPVENVSDCLAEVLIENSFETRTLFLAVRLMEHCMDFELVSKFLDAKEGDVIYVENLDFERLSSIKDFSYVWPLRLTYLTPHRYMRRLGVEPIGREMVSTPEGMNVEPFKYAIGLWQSLTESYDEYFRQSEEDNLSTRSIQGFHSMFEDILRILDAYSAFAILGMGHKGLTLLAYLKQSQRDPVEIFDLNSSRCGTFVFGKPIRKPSGNEKVPLIISTISRNHAQSCIPNYRTIRFLDYSYPYLFERIS